MNSEEKYNVLEDLCKEILSLHPRESDTPLEKAINAPLSTVKKIKNLLKEQDYLIETMGVLNPVKQTKIRDIREKLLELEIPEETLEKYKDKEDEQPTKQITDYEDYFKDEDTSKKEARHFLGRFIAEELPFKNVKKKDQLWYFSNPVYSQKGETELRNLLQKKLGHVITTHDIREIKSKVKSFTTIKREEKEPKSIIAVKNGHLDVENQRLYSPSSARFVVNELPINYNPDIDCPQFKELLKENFPSEKDRIRFQEFIGTALKKKKMHKKGCIITGPTNSGKSTLIKTIRHVLGTDNVCSQSPKALADSRWGKIKLRENLLNATDEVSSGKIYGLDVIKKIMDGNPISAEKKGEDPEEFAPSCEHVFAANQTPTASRKDDAFWNRWLVLTMPETVSEEEKIEGLAEKIAEEEKQGILNWMLEGLNRFLDNDCKFSEPQSWDESRDKWLNWGNSIQRFIQKKVVHNEGNKMSSKELYAHYRDFVSDTDLGVEGQKELTKQLKKLDFVQYSENFRFGGEKKRGFKNIGVGVSESDRRKEELVEVVRGLDDGDGVEYLDVFEGVELDEGDFEELVDDLLEEGDLYEPKPGFLKAL